MAFLDFLKKKTNGETQKDTGHIEDKSIEKDKVLNSFSTHGVNVTVSQPKDETKVLGTHTHNGIKYKTICKTENGYSVTYVIPEYNDVLVVYTFLEKYPTIKKPELLHEYDYPHMIFSKVGVDNVSKLHKDIFLRGFYDKAKNREILSTLKVGEIKDIISSLGLSIKGKKEELIDGLISQANELSLSSALGDDYYSVSEYGKHWMYEHTLEYEWYNEPDDYPSFESYKLVRSKSSKKDIEKNRCLKEIKNDKESFGRYEYDTLIKILEEEGNKREAVICLLKELLIDVSGALNYANWKSCGFNKDMIKECSNIYFTPYLIKTLPKYHDYYEPSMIAEAYELNLPINACSVDDFKDIAEMMFDKTFDEETKNAYQNKLQNNLIRLGLNKH